MALFSCVSTEPDVPYLHIKGEAGGGGGCHYVPPSF